MDTMLTRALFLTLITQQTCYGYFWGNSGYAGRNNVPSEKPEFEDTEKEIFVGVGKTAFLPCQVNNIGDKKVSWIRTRDLHILTYDRDTFTSDNRFSSANLRIGSTNWGLRIRKSQPNDSGTYECQVNTEPKLNRKVHLEVDENLNDTPYSHVVEEAFNESPKSGPTTKILGLEEQFVQSGSTVTLTCLILPTDPKINNIYWLKDGRLVSFQAARGGISTHTDRSDKRTTSSLTLADVTAFDTGNYSCKPQRGPQHSIQLIVLQGERSEAVQGLRNLSQVTEGSSVLLLLCGLIIYVITHFS